MPPWTEDGGYPALFKRLRDPATREKIKAEVQKPTDSWENLYLDAGGPEHILLAAFKSERLKPLTGKTLAEVARMRGKDPIDTAMDLIAEDDKVVVRNHWTGTEAASGAQYEFSGIVIWRIAHRQLVERWAYLTPPQMVKS